MHDDLNIHVQIFRNMPISLFFQIVGVISVIYVLFDDTFPHQ